MTRSTTSTGALAICVAAALWGLDGVVLTPRLSNLAVPFVVFLLHVVPFGLMQPVLFRCWGRLQAFDRRTWLVLFLVSLTGGLIGTLCIVKALFIVEFKQLSVVVLLQKLQPVFAILLAAVLLKEQLSARFVAWAAAAVSGGYLLTFGLQGPDLSGGDQTFHAAVFAIVAAACFGAATVFGKLLLGTVDFMTATFARYGLTSVLAASYLVLAGVGLPFSATTPGNWAIVVLISLTTGSGAIFLYYWGLTRVKATVATICELCLPLSAVVLDHVVNGARLGAWQWVGGFVLIGSILRISTMKADPKAVNPAEGERRAEGEPRRRT
ncbi:MAG: DMT family transporter [Thermoanaerobaculales bacterium]|nr:DMT family transporter [Thermoanaerobaculales bacterium]